MGCVKGSRNNAVQVQQKNKNDKDVVVMILVSHLLTGKAGSDGSPHGEGDRRVALSHSRHLRGIITQHLFS